MNPRVMDAIGYISRIVEDHWDQIVDHSEILDELENQGFSSEEIADAFRWIEFNTLGSDSLEQGESANAKTKILPPLRVLTSVESSKIHPKAHGLLMSLYERGLLDPILLEEVIEKVMQSDSEEVDVQELRRTAALTLFNKAKADWQDILEESLHGSSDLN